MAEHARIEHARGDVFLDARGHGRAMRLSWHPEADVVVLSLWREDMCAGTFRMPHEDVGAFIDALIDGLRDAPGVHLPPTSTASTDPQVNADDDRLGETRAIGAQQGPGGFASWAFEGSSPGDRASAS